MKALLSKRAARAAERIDAHWREHADDPGLFARELLDASCTYGMANANSHRSSDRDVRAAHGIALTHDAMSKNMNASAFSCADSVVVEPQLDG